MNLLQMSLSGAVMILVIVVIRALAINKLPKKFFLVLWAVVAARLLIPFSLRSAFSVYTLLEQFAPAAETIKDMPAVPLTPMAPVKNITPLPAPAAPTDNTAAVFVDLGIVVWAVGALACAAFFAVAYLKCRREFKASLPVDNEYVKLWLSEHRFHRTIEIRQSGKISAPLTYGVFRPVILMPKTTDWDDLDTLKYVLAHEHVHIRRFDAVTKLVLTAALCIHWFNPAVWIMYVLANRDIELSCDEAVIRQFGENTKTAYAMALIRIEETRNGLTPLCNNFSKNAIEERIIAIMKMKRTSLAALIVATVLVVGVTTVFATSAKTDDGLSHKNSVRIINAADTVTNSTARFLPPNVEWWTYDEYKEWLEKEKVQLQDMIGEWGWTSGRGEFVWTQEIVDEAIAMYENVLENIKNGMLYSKTIYGDDGLFGTSYVMSYNPADIETTYEDTAIDFSPYAPYGLVWDEDKKALFWNGQRVRYFLDGADIDGMGGMAIRLEYTDAELKGDIDVHTVRERVQNSDGSVDFMGPLTGLKKYSQAEFEVRTFRTPSLADETYTFSELAQTATETETLLKAYVPFGLSYEIDPTTCQLSMSWQGKPVHSVFDAKKAIWIGNSLHGLYLGPDAVDLEAVYKQGKLTGLRETEAKPVEEITFVEEKNAALP